MDAFPVSVLRDLQFAAPGGIALHADLYLPEGAEKPLPVIVWVHAGGWRFGTRKLAPDFSRFFAASGFAMAAVDYRLTHLAPFPAQIEDVKTAIRWLRCGADALGLNAGRIGLWGSSAGGHLAALAAVTPCGTFEPVDAPYAGCSSRVDAVVAGYPPIDFLQMDAHRPPPGTRSEDPESLHLPRLDMRSADPDSFESLLVGGPIEQYPDRVRAANPLAYITPDAPPFLVLHGLADTTIAPHQSELLYRGAVGQGLDATLCLIEGLGHGFLHRTHLDDGPPRRMTIRRFTPGRGEVEETCARRIFPMIEQFFRRSLAAGGPRG